MKYLLRFFSIRFGILILFLLFLFINIKNSAANNRYKHELDSLWTLINESKAPKLKADHYSEIARYYSTCDQIPLAIYYYKVSASIYLMENKYDRYCQQIESLGVMYALSNDPKMGLFYFSKALDITEKHHLGKMQFFSLIQNIGNMYMEVEEWRKAIQYLKICETFFKSDQCKNKKYIIATHINIGTAYQKLNILDSALKYNDLAIINAQKFKINDYISGIYINIGEINILLKNYNQAITSFKQSMKFRSLYSEHQDYYRSIYGIGIAESREKNYKIALNHLSTAIDYFYKNKDFINTRDASREICAIYELQKDYKNYATYSKIYDIAKDSIYARKISSNMDAMRIKYEMDKIQEKSKSEIELLTQKNQLNTLRWIIAICILILTCVIFTTLYFRHKINKRLMNVELLNFQLEQKQLEIEINFKKRDIENLALHIVQKNEFLEQIKNEVKTLKDDIKPEKQTKLKSISLKIAQSARKNKELEKLQQNIDQINWTFINKLTEKFPELTEKEKRLCTLLKLNFNSKEIAGLNNVSEDAVIKARHRMRKKMGLSPEENLTEFIHRI